MNTEPILLHEQQQDWLQTFYAQGPLSAGMATYRRSFLGNHGKALADTFPRLATRLPPEQFRMLAQQLLCEHPVRSGDLNDYGAELPALLAQHAARETQPDATAWAALAELEWQEFCLLRAADSARPLTQNDIARLPGLTLGLVASARVHPLRFSLESLLSLDTTPPVAETSTVLMYRVTDATQVFNAGIVHRPLSDAEALFLQALAEPATLLTALAQVLKTHTAFDPAPCLQHLLQHQLLEEKQS